MTEMWSQQGEKVPFEKPVEAKGAFLVFLCQLSNEGPLPCSLLLSPLS